MHKIFLLTKIFFAYAQPVLIAFLFINYNIIYKIILIKKPNSLCSPFGLFFTLICCNPLYIGLS